MTKAQYGALIVRWFASGFTDETASSFLNLFPYGGLADTLAQVFSIPLKPWLGEYESLHLVFFLGGSLALVGTFLLGRVLVNSRVGFFSALILLTLPRFYGETAINPKDIPFATAYVFALWALARLYRRLPRAGLLNWLTFGLAAGVAMGIRVGGLVLWAYLGFALLVRVLDLVRVSAISRLDCLRQTLWMGLSFAFSYLLMLSCWPWAVAKPLERPLEALEIMKHFAWPHFLLYRGQDVYAPALPWHYVPTWIVVSTPVLYLLLGAAALVSGSVGFLLSEKRASGAWICVLGFLFPIVYVIYEGSVLYDGYRHLLFVLPAFAVLAAMMLERLAEGVSPFLQKAILGSLGAYAALLMLKMYQLFPYEYVFFNELQGGLAGAYGRYETEYWGTSFKEGVEMLRKYRLSMPLSESGEDLAESAPRQLKVASSQHPFSTQYFLDKHPGEFQYVTEIETADAYLSTTRHMLHESVDWPVIGVVEREGVPLLLVRAKR